MGGRTLLLGDRRPRGSVAVVLLGGMWGRMWKSSVYGAARNKKSYQVEKDGAAVLPPARVVERSHLPLTPASRTGGGRAGPVCTRRNFFYI